MDVVNFQAEDSFRGEASHSVIALNRAVCRHGKKDKILGLESRLWVCDSIWPYIKIYIGTYEDKIYYDNISIQINAWHCRWWQKGRAQAEWIANKKSLIARKNDKEYMTWFDNQEHNFNVVKNFMEKFNNMIPAIKSEFDLVKGPIRRPRYELGEL